MIWFTADFHLSHKNIIKYCERPFINVEEMDAVILRNLFDTIESGDALYYLGDLAFRKDIAITFFEELKDIEVHYIIGNHDSSVVIDVAKEKCASVTNLKNIVVEGKPITLCHYSMRVWHKSHFNAWQLFGHSHGRLTPVGKQYDVGVDANKFLPISFQKLQNIMRAKPNNFNYIRPKK